MSHQAAYLGWRGRIVATAVLAAMFVLGSTVAVSAEPPVVTTEAPSAFGDQDATLSGMVNPQDLAVTSCRFEYGTTSAYGAAVPCVPDSLGTGTSDVPVNAQIGGLEPGTVYHFRLVSSNADGLRVGNDLTFATTGSPTCSNADRRLEQGIATIQLPDCMALEQLNPPRKLSQRAASPTISADGERVAFKTLAALAETPGNLNALFGDIYVATRGEEGWSASPTSPPYPVNNGWDGARDMVRSFDPALSRWVVIGSTPEGSQFQAGIAQVFTGGLGGFFQAMSPVLVPVDGGAHDDSNVSNSELQAASADHSRLFFAMGDANVTYQVGDPAVSGPSSDKNVYLAQLDSGGQPSIKLAARDEIGPDAGKAWGGNCGARMGGIGGVGVGWRTQGAVSSDGSLAYLSARAAQPATGACSETNKLRILERTESAGLADLTELISSECTRIAPACKTEAEANGNDFYQGASLDQSKVYFTTNRQLVDSDLDGTSAECSGFSGVSGCDLYLYDAEAPAGEQLVQVSAGEASASHPAVGQDANIFNGTVSISSDGTRVYFAAAGVLTPDPNPVGKIASEYPAADPKLYAWDTATEETRFVGALSSADLNLWGGSGSFLNSAYPVPATGEDSNGNEVGGNGHVLLFQSRAALAANDTDDSRLDVFRYDDEDVPPTLQCVSCRPGGPDSAPFNVTARGAENPDLPGTGFAQENRWTSEDGEAVLIQTFEPLVPGDLNGGRDDYLWREGELTRLPGTTPPAGWPSIGETPPVVSHDGSEVAFTSYSKLLPTDIDTAPDVYVARSEGGFPYVPPRDPCVGEACQPPPSAGLTDTQAGSADLVSPGNVKPPQVRCPKGKRKVIRHGKVRCVKRPARKKGAKSKKNRANNNRGDQK